MIELRGLKKTYAHSLALDNVNLSIQKGEIFGIIGKSGAGKSTLLRSINLLERPDEGQVNIDGEDITRLDPDKLRLIRHKMSMIFQQFNLLQSKTVYQNIALPMHIQGHSKVAIHQKIHELIALVGLQDKLQAYPSQLSGGQQQRVAIARALSTSPSILLCDEATSALDPETTQIILDLLKKINHLYGLTIVFITHEMEVLKRLCDRVAVMEAGKILEVASLASILNEPKSIARERLFKELSPALPSSLQANLLSEPTNHPILRLFFQGENASLPFISRMSRQLHLDITILLANIDQFQSITCGVLIIELEADKSRLEQFIQYCEQEHLTVEVLGYVARSPF